MKEYIEQRIKEIQAAYKLTTENEDIDSDEMLSRYAGQISAYEDILKRL